VRDHAAINLICLVITFIPPVVFLADGF